MRTELPTLLHVFKTDCDLQYSESYTGTIHQETTRERYQFCTFLDRAFQSLISENFNNFVLTIGCTAVAVYWKGYRPFGESKTTGIIEWDWEAIQYALGQDCLTHALVKFDLHVFWTAIVIPLLADCLF